MPVLPCTSIIILAGGLSKRMGEDKRELTLKGKSLIRIILDLAKSLSDDLIISANDLLPDFQDHKVIPDQIEAGGPVVAIISTLNKIKYKNALILTCDMPFITINLLKSIASEDQDNKIIYYKNHKSIYPFPALFPVSVYPFLIKSYAKGITSMKGIFEQIPSRSILLPLKFDELAFLNLNRPDDLIKAQNFLGNIHGIQHNL